MHSEDRYHGENHIPLDENDLQSSMSYVSYTLSFGMEKDKKVILVELSSTLKTYHKEVFSWYKRTDVKHEDADSWGKDFIPL